MNHITDTTLSKNLTDGRYSGYECLRTPEARIWSRLRDWPS